MGGRSSWPDKVFARCVWRSVKYERVYINAYESVSHARSDLDSPDFYTDCRRVLSENACMTVNLFGRHAQFDQSVANIAAAFGE